MNQRIHKIFGVFCVFVYLYFFSKALSLHPIDWILALLLAYVFSGGYWTEDIFDFGISPDLLDHKIGRELFFHSGLIPLLLLQIFGYANVMINAIVIAWSSHIFLDLVGGKNDENVKVDYDLWQLREAGFLIALLTSLYSSAPILSSVLLFL